MFAPFQGNPGPQQGRPYQAIPCELLCPEQRKVENIPENDLGKDDDSHDGDNKNDCYLRNSIDYMAYPLHIYPFKGKANSFFAKVWNVVRTPLAVSAGEVLLPCGLGLDSPHMINYPFLPRNSVSRVFHFVSVIFLITVFQSGYWAVYFS